MSDSPEHAYRNLVMTTDGLFQDLLKRLQQIKKYSNSNFADINYDAILKECYDEFVSCIVDPLTKE